MANRKYTDILRAREGHFESSKRCSHHVLLCDPNGCTYCIKDPEAEAKIALTEAVGYAFKLLKFSMEK